MRTQSSIAASDQVHAGSLATLQREGRLVTKLGAIPVLVVWHDDRAYAIEDRCPHLGFPLHQGTVEAGLLTCHWHHARFDLASGCTLDLWADDARGFDVLIEGDDVWVRARDEGDPIARHARRLGEGLEQGITLVIAKAILGLLESGADARTIVETTVDFGTANRGRGWGSGLTVLVAMANVLDVLDPNDRALALVHAAAFVARDTAGEARYFPVRALEAGDVPADRLSEWYRRFIETRSSDAARRVLATALESGRLRDADAMLFAALTDHVFVDEGHALDFTNKAREAVGLLGEGWAARVLPTVVRQAANAERSEELSEWRHPHDLVALAHAAEAELVELVRAGAPRANGHDPAALAWALLADDPQSVVDALLTAARAGASLEELGRAVAYAAALRITRFHVQNDFADWNSVHHSFTYANALYQALLRNPTPELARGLVHGVLRVYLDRFLNVPGARIPTATTGSLEELAECWDAQGQVDRAGALAYGYLRGGGEQAALVAALGHALLAEDAQFHWFQVYEAAVRQASVWPVGSEEAALILTGLARFLAAHTPTRRELPTVVRTAVRLRRGERLYEEA